MTPFRTPLSALRGVVASHPSALVIKQAHITDDGLCYSEVCYSQFEKDIEATASYWVAAFSAVGIYEGSIIGVWLKGTSYDDLLHIWGISRAGYIPQLISLRMTDPSVTLELLSKAGAAALIHDPSLTTALQDTELPSFPAHGMRSICGSKGSKERMLGAVPNELSGDQVVMIFHTSGSTSGAPKLVPITARWMDCQIQKTSTFIKAYPTLRAMVKIALHVMTLPSSEGFLSLTIAYGDLPLDPSDEAWAWGHGLHLINSFGSTEVGIILVSHDAKGAALVPLSPSAYEFVPFDNDENAQEYLVEMVVPPESPNCPHPTLRDKDGKFHTGDLFLEIAPGQYVYRGRDDDWIKMEMALRCDAKAIEDDALQHRGDDLIHAVVAIGTGRPQPVIIVEPKDEIALQSKEKERDLRCQVLKRITPFHRRRYKHESIDDTNFIRIVPQWSLPRGSKGNSRRRQVEKEFEQVLDEMFKVKQELGGYL
ncbi:hypothetical protein F53441_11507 [Fusarium austroafricanum]|uniref:AMP-dependent synthetase/ligase domain-containing protein n=1 Tax=Fusarium austroafricanum TaxID=2364996 RepID=A0A8H4K5L3_9HYPO|nr:hypothetical protein F53441_11507 [Fusarium austroafricanum]